MKERRTLALQSLLDDAELGELPRVPAPAHVDVLDTRRRGAVVRPAHELLDGLFLALGQKLDASVVAVLHPPADAQAPGLTLRRRTEEDPLDSPANEQLDTLAGHGRDP
jgi:hypothetical protein